MRRKASHLISSNQIKAARALLGITAAQLGAISDVPHRTVQRLEAHKGIPPSRGGTLDRVKLALEQAGIEFLGDPMECPGVQMRRGS
jgi:hypothetical protein